MFFSRRSKETSPAEKKMSIERQVSLDVRKQAPLSHGALTSGLPVRENVKQVQGLNSAIQPYVVSLLGTADHQHLWQLNLSQQAGEQKRFLTILGASTFFLNYAQGDYPSRIDIVVDEIAGTVDQTGNSSHSVATLVPQGPAITVVNPGGILGFNVQYSLLGEPRSFDISNLPVLTFGLTAGEARQAASYPLMEAVILDLNITRVLR